MQESINSLSQMHSLNPVVTNDDEKILKGIIDVSSKSTAIGIPVLTINKFIGIIMNKIFFHKKGVGKFISIANAHLLHLFHVAIVLTKQCSCLGDARSLSGGEIISL